MVERLDNAVPIRCGLQQHAATEVDMAGIVYKDVDLTQVPLDALEGRIEWRPLPPVRSRSRDRCRRSLR